MRSTILATGLALMVFAAAGQAPAGQVAAGQVATKTSLFASEGNARSVCGPSKVVWVVLDGGTYYRAGSPGYQKSKGQRNGAYTCEKVALKEGGHLAPDGR